MLVVDLNLLRLIDLLNLVQQVLLNRLFARDTKNVVRHQRPIDQRLSRFDDVAAVDLEVLAVRHQVFAFDARFAADNDRSFSALSLGQDFDFAVDFGDHGRIFRLASLENLGDTRQTTSDVRHAACFTRHFGEHSTGIRSQHLPWP